MALERSVNRTLILAGTRPFPGPFPEVGKLIFTKLDLRFDRTDEEVKVVVIEKVITPTRCIILTIPRDKVRGVFRLRDKDKIEELDGSWHLGPDVQELNGEMWGVAYIDKTANVVVNVEYSCAIDEVDVAAEREAMFQSISFPIPGGC